MTVRASIGSIAGAAGFVAVVAGCGGAAPRGAPPATGDASAAALLARARRHFAELPLPAVQDPARVALGRALFFETRVAADERVGCVTCHDPARWGTDGLPRSRGVLGRETPFNAPTVLNADGQIAQHWRGDRASLEDEASRALLGPAAYGLASNDEAVGRLEALPGYREAFRRAFPGEDDPLQVANWGAALAAYQRTLTTPGPIDRFLAGDATSLDAAARDGLAAFLDAGCAGCHDGPSFGGRSLRRVGDGVEPLKVPPLRNVTHTPPYFHDGSVSSLDDAVARMVTESTTRPPRPGVVAKIVAFLGALAGDVPPAFAPP